MIKKAMTFHLIFVYIQYPGCKGTQKYAINKRLTNENFYNLKNPPMKVAEMRAPR